MKIIYIFKFNIIDHTGEHGSNYLFKNLTKYAIRMTKIKKIETINKVTPKGYCIFQTLSM